jgi:uncharacterized protein
LTKLRIAPDLTLPVDAITKTYATLGIRGSGKTNTAVDLVEEAIKAQQCVSIIDPLDVWWGLRSSKDGKSPGLKVYIFGGRYADVPLEPTGGELVARFVVENRVPVILSLKHLRKNDQRRFVAEYGEALYHLNKEPLFQVIDECARYLPQQVTRFAGPRNENWAARCLDAITDLYSEARVAGIGGMLIGQRGSRINKDVLEQMDVLICMRTQGPRDRKAMEAWIDAHGTEEQKATFMREIAAMPTGTGYFWDPVEDIFKKVAFRERETFDSSVTPKVGKTVVTPKAHAEVDVALLREKMAATVERAKAEDPKALRARIAQLEKDVLKDAPEPVVMIQTERVEVPVLDDRRFALLHETFKLAEAATQRAAEELRELFAGVASEFQAVRDAYQKRIDVQDRHRAHAAVEATERFNKAASKPKAAVSANGALSKAERGLLRVLAQRDSCDRNELALLAGYSPDSGGVSEALGRLRALGYATAGWPIQITREGRHAVGDVEPLPTGSELRRYWLNHTLLSKAERTILNVLFDAGDEGIDRNELAREAGYSPDSGGVSEAIGRLRAMKLMRSGWPARAAEELLV